MENKSLVILMCVLTGCAGHDGTVSDVVPPPPYVAQPGVVAPQADPCKKYCLTKDLRAIAGWIENNTPDNRAL